MERELRWEELQTCCGSSALLCDYKKWLRAMQLQQLQQQLSLQQQQQQILVQEQSVQQVQQTSPSN